MTFLYALLAGWIIVLSLYLSEAFKRIDKLNKRIDDLANGTKK